MLLTMYVLQVGLSKSEANGMFSAEGEFVDGTHRVLLEGPVEVGGRWGWESWWW